MKELYISKSSEGDKTWHYEDDGHHEILSVAVGKGITYRLVRMGSSVTHSLTYDLDSFQSPNSSARSLSQFVAARPVLQESLGKVNFVNEGYGFLSFTSLARSTSVKDELRIFSENLNVLRRHLRAGN